MEIKILNKDVKHITVFEHQSLRTDRGEKRLTEAQLETLQNYYGEKGVPYYSLIHNGIKFCEYVGVIQLGKTIIEVLPKADKNNDITLWRKLLIGMLHAVGIFDIHAPSSSALQLKSNSILDLYFELFVIELESLIHKGLIKKYRKVEDNHTALKGSIQFSKHLQKNLIHQERFFVRYSIYDKEHKIHKILLKALKLLLKINTNNVLNSRLGALLLDFPEMPDIKITDALFKKIVYNRKTDNYRNALEIARLILMNYHPDVSKGNNNVLALMFDMNVLWEQFVYVSIRKHKSTDTTITAQTSKYFWKPDNGNRSKMRPDIVVNKEKKDCLVLDTKWKNLKGYNPSPNDLRQMYVYHEYYNAKKVALIYPGSHTTKIKGSYLHPVTSEIVEKECSVISLSVEQDIKQWQKNIFMVFNSWKD